MSKTTWKETLIFKELENRTGEYTEAIKAFLNISDVMDKIERILNDGGTTPKDFTLHNADHSYRVAERMWELIPDETKVKLSDYELGFLLLSAYLHDIGMSPEFEKVQRHKEYLVTDKKDILTEGEISDFQKWIDNDEKIISIDIRKEKIEDYKISDYILSYYIRHKHNDWSGEWIKENLGRYTLKNYPAWNDDLVGVCMSHHFGLDLLLMGKFDPKPITNAVVHLRYLAMCLRVADILENDPERTPEVILNHRMISTKSLKFWIKDRQFNLIRNGNTFSVYARPDKAYLHKAIEDTADAIESELKLCDELVKLRPIGHSPFADLSFYNWEIIPSVLKDIAPKDGSYVYIQGTFRPNTTKILELLGGNQLYGNPIWAFRELLQNAFDAVKERIAYQIIRDDRDSDIFLQKLGELCRIKISLVNKDDGYWLICKDDGVGMTKSIIEKYFLESGSSKRHEVKDLERRCKEHGFNLARTGQFGIGVLSYFMIADKAIIKTRREQLTGYEDKDSLPWHFEINGTHEFGELKKMNEPIVGTEIELKLTNLVQQSIGQWDNEFRSLLHGIIVKSPCVIEYDSCLSGTSIKIDFGWLKSKQDILGLLSANFKNLVINQAEKIDDIITEKDFRKSSKNLLNANQSHSEILEVTDFLFDEGELDEICKYRIFIPYFRLKHGYSFFYIKEKEIKGRNYIQKINNGYLWKPSFGRIDYSLKGVHIDYSSGSVIDSILSNVYIELDFEAVDEKIVSVSRHHLFQSQDFERVRQLIVAKVFELLTNNMQLFDNMYGLLNFKHSRIEPQKQYFGLNYSDENGVAYEWTKIQLPFYTLPPSKGTKSVLKSKIENIDFRNYPYVKTYDGKNIDWVNNYSSKYRLGFNSKASSYQDYVYIPFVIEFLGQTKNKIINSQFNFNIIDVPASLNNVLLFSGIYSADTDVFICNKHNLFEYYDSDVLAYIFDVGLDIEVSYLSDKKYAVALLIYCILKFDKDERWLGLCYKKAEIINALFMVIQADEILTLCKENVLTIYKLGFYSRIYSSSEIDKYISRIEDDEYIIR